MEKHDPSKTSPILQNNETRACFFKYKRQAIPTETSLFSSLTITPLQLVLVIRYIHSLPSFFASLVHSFPTHL